MSLNILLLCNRPAKNADASTVTDHLDAFVNFSSNKVTQLSFLRNLPSRLNLNKFDVLVIHYTLAIGYMREHFLSDHTLKRIRDFKGLKVVFIQDEYRSVNKVLAALNYLNVDILFTCVPDSEINKVYSSGQLPKTLKINTLTGYVPQSLLKRKTTPMKNRPIDVAYRTRKPPFWLGELGFEKWQIADRFIENTEKANLFFDISYEESKRIYGEKWIEFVSSAKTMLGVESGASVFDFSGGLQEKVDEFVAINSGVTFKEVQELFLMPYEGKIKFNQISPRCFESAALKTVMILYEGYYSGILKPWRHYIPLKKDFSNISQVINAIKDHKLLESIADTTFNEIAMNSKYSYAGFVKQFDEVVQKIHFERHGTLVGKNFNFFEYSLSLFSSPRYLFQYIFTRSLQRLLLGTKLRRLIFSLWGTIPFRFRNILRPLLRIIGR